MRPIRHSASFFLLVQAALVAGEAQAQPARPGDAVSVYAAQGVDLNLRQVPRAIFRGDLRRESSFFVGVGLARERGTLGASFDALRGTLAQDVRHGYELVLLKHHGRQHHVELGAAYLLRSPDLALGPVGVNVAAGLGLSHAFGTPSYEDGPEDDPSRRYRTQLLMLLEAEWRWATQPWSLVTRMHHRSGAYGLIAPRHVGSNFVVAGVRYRF